MVSLVVDLVLISVLGGVPAYVIGQRRGVYNPWVAFIPGVGPIIVLLWSIGRTGWLVLMLAIPLVNIAFAIWLLFALPRRHGRTLLWVLGFGSSRAVRDLRLRLHSGSGT
jgi:hypothetical protein